MAMLLGQLATTWHLLYGLTIADLKVLKDKGVRVETSDQADMLASDAAENSYGIERLGVDAVGVGAGVVGDLIKLGLHPQEYMSGLAPDPEIHLPGDDDLPVRFDSLRSQMIYLYARGIQLGLIKRHISCPYLKELQKEAMVHHFDTTDKVLRVAKKEKIKERLGFSPDLLDLVVMGLYVALRREKVTFRVRTA